jgi:hypothetical protein
MMNNRPFQNEYLELYTMCKEFHTLPYEGGVLDQPAKIMSAFYIVSNTINQHQQGRRGMNG